MRSEKTHLINYVGSLLNESTYVYFVSFQGLKVKEMGEVRGKLADLGAECHVVKNAIITKAAEVHGIKALDSLNLTLGTAMVCGNGDASAVAKFLAEYGKTREAVQAKAGLMDGVKLSVADISAIADLPSKDVMRSMFLGVLQAPSRNLACLLNAKAATVLNVLNAYKEKLDSNN